MDTNGDGIGAGSGEDSSGQRHEGYLPLFQHLRLGVQCPKEVAVQLRSIYDKPSYRFAGKKYPVNTVAPQ